MTLRVGSDISLSTLTQRRDGPAFISLPGRKRLHDTRLEPSTRRVKGEPPPDDPRYMIVAYGKDARILDTHTNQLSEPMSRQEAMEIAQRQTGI
jgi:hypothetical protein